MDDGSKSDASLKFCTNCYTYNDCLFLIKVLNDKFLIKATIQSAGAKSRDQYIIYIKTESMPLLRELVSPYIIPEMKYKII